jgi:hypothetical protein
MSSIGSLADQIVEGYATAVFNDQPQDFLPHSHIPKLITEAAIIEELELEDKDGDLEKDKDKILVDFILKHAKKVFATTIITGISSNDLYKVMQTFKDNTPPFQDDSLPLKKDVMSKLACFSGKFWNKLRTHNFLKNQWIFFAPVFSKSKFKLDLEPEHIFPFIEKSNDVKEGTFSHVYKVTIHPSHQEDPTLTVRL